LNGLALQMADRLMPGPPGSDITDRYAAMVAGVLFREQGELDLIWENPGQISNALVTAVAAQGSTIYAGTLKHGIYRQTGADYDWEPFVSLAQIGGSAVLCLAADASHLWAGTTSGLYQIDNSGMPSLIAGGWAPGAMVLSVLPVGGLLLVGTATHGLWREVASNSWQQVPGIGV
jgi:hypothetical protein